jgi:lysozyme family protein
MTNFRRAVDIVIGLEGGDRLITDTGGLTKWGISQRAYPRLNIAALTRAEAEAIYKRDYWDKVRADELAHPLALFVFDAAVNQGVGRAKKMLQKAVNQMSNADLEVDGVLGPRTMAAVSSIHPRELAVNFMTRRVMRYIILTHFRTYGKGWLNRLFRISLRA